MNKDFEFLNQKIEELNKALEKCNKEKSELMLDVDRLNNELELQKKTL